MFFAAIHPEFREPTCGIDVHSPIKAPHFIPRVLMNVQKSVTDGTFD